MHRRQIVTVLLAAALMGLIPWLCGCDERPAKDLEPKPAATAPIGGTDIWRKRTDCSDRADVLAKRHGWVEARKDPTFGKVVEGWNNHYSLNHEGCFVLVSHETNTGADKSVLWNALENAIVADWSGPPDNECTIWAATAKKPEPSDFSCDKTLRFIGEQMNDGSADSPRGHTP
jgi:hypothetical protein